MQFQTECGQVSMDIDDVVVAGWTGRNEAGVQHHIEELAAIGVAPPSSVPLFYRVSKRLLTTESTIDVLGETSSGEAEPMIVRQGDKFFLGLASDHTDRALETFSVAASKQICAKPCATFLWDFTDVNGHLDQISIQSWIEEDGSWVLYQNGTLADIRPLKALIDAFQLPPNSAMLCGTFAAIKGVRPAAKFRAVMRDPIRGKEIKLSYTARALPIIA